MNLKDKYNPGCLKEEVVQSVLNSVGSQKPSEFAQALKSFGLWLAFPGFLKNDDLHYRREATELKPLSILNQLCVPKIIETLFYYFIVFPIFSFFLFRRPEMLAKFLVHGKKSVQRN